VFKLSANETPFGPVRRRRWRSTRKRPGHLEDYPEGTSRVLARAIGRAFGLDPDRIICGAGSDEILNHLAHTYLKHGDEAISTSARLPGVPDRDHGETAPRTSWRRDLISPPMSTRS
jgi:histidinol-phosphate aminotransferase